MMCSSEVIAITFERQLDPDLLGLYLFHSAMLQIDKNEIILACPFCPYYIITFNDHTMNFFYCHKEECKKGSCTVCSKELPQAMDDYDEDMEELKNMENKVEVHFKCWEFRSLK